MKELSDYFTLGLWLTENQMRDSLFGVNGWTTEAVQQLTNCAREEAVRRKGLPKEFVCCPRCRGYHNSRENPDCLCDKCERDAHMYGWDQEHGVTQT